jgi:hypothetical protein
MRRGWACCQTILPANFQVRDFPPEQGSDPTPGRQLYGPIQMLGSIFWVFACLGFRRDTLFWAGVRKLQ